MAQQKTLADFELVRKTTTSFADLRLQFVRPFIGETTAKEWKFCNIANPSISVFRFAYAVCVSKGALVLLDTTLTNGRDHSDHLYSRYTSIHLWELIIDCWTDAAQANTTPLCWIGISDIVNPDVRHMIQREIECHGKSSKLSTGCVCVKSGSITWDQNYFIRSAKHVADALNKNLISATLSMTDTREVFGWASNGCGGDDIFLEMDMVLELR